MKTIKLSLVQPALTSMVIGVIATLGILLILETTDTWWVFVLALAFVGCGVYLARKTNHHFHGHHHHRGDSLIDTVPLGILLLANVLHPMVDGFSVFQTFSHEGMVEGLLIASVVLLHECIRQAALIPVFKTLGIKWYWVIGVTLVSIAGGGVLSILGSSLVERYEYIADLATIFAYTFIVSEYYLHAKEGKGSWKMFWAIVGILLAVALQHHMHMH